MNILFANFSGLRFTAATPDRAPLGGSESALAYLARALARRGHHVALAVALPPDEGGMIEGVRHFPLDAVTQDGFWATEHFDAVVICNAPAASAPIKAVAPTAQIVFWAHALPDQPAMQPVAQAQTRLAPDLTVCVSAWQHREIERAFGPVGRATVIGNGIAPAFENMFASAAELGAAKSNRAAYTATPFRGLSVLARAMEGLDRDTRLDVFSSMRVYQANDNDHAPLFVRLGQNPAVALCGSVAQADLAHRLRGCAFLFYPCIYPETFCISVAEALAAGLHVVTTDLGALRDTAMGFADLVKIPCADGEVLARDFRAAMRRAVDAFAEDPQAWAERRYDQTRRVSDAYRWDLRAAEWETALRG